MRYFAGLVFGLSTAIGVWLIASGDGSAWIIAAISGLFFLIAIFEPRLRRSVPACAYRLAISDDEVACEHPVRPGESIRWDDVIRVWFVTTSDGPWLPDAWILLEGEQGGCSFPTEAVGFGEILAEFKRRFAGFDFLPLIAGGTNDARHVCWERKSV